MAIPTPRQSQQTLYSPVANHNTHILQPPKSPASTAATPSFATSADYFSHAGSRKRSRPDSSYNGRQLPTDWTTTPSWAQAAATPSDGGIFSSGYGQNSLLVNEQYKLNGGFDTPGLAANTESDHTGNRDLESRRWLRDRQPSFRTSQQALSGPLARERNGLARMNSSPNGEPSTSWTRFAFSLVGKAFTFGTSVFKGFYAGGGASYGNASQARSIRPSASPYQNGLRSSTPVPGSWAEEDFMGDFEQDNPYSPPQTASRPPNKRRQTDRDAWVMIGTPDATEDSPKRKVSGNSVPKSGLANAAGTRPTASRASSRRSLLPAPVTRLSLSPSRSPERRASFAPVRSPGSRPSTAGRLDLSHHPTGSGSRPSTGNRPSTSGTVALSPEAEKFVARRVKQERKADRAMNSMGRQLEELIRQGQQALGTRVDVDMEDEDGGEGW